MRIRKLTPRQALFVAHVVAGESGKSAAVLAGFSPRTAEKQASELLAKPHVHAEVERLIEERNRRAEVTGEYVLRHLKGIVEDALSAKRWCPAVALRALDLLGRHLGLWSDQRLRGSDASPEDQRRRDAAVEAAMASVTMDEARAYVERVCELIVEHVKTDADRAALLAAIEQDVLSDAGEAHSTGR